MRKLYLVVLILLLLGCEPKPVESKKLVIAISGLQQSNEKTFFRTFTRLFEAEHGIQPEVIYVAPDQLLNQIVSKEIEPDVIMVDTARMKSYLDQDLMAPMGWIDLEPDRTFTHLMDAYTHKSDRYFAPVSMDIYMTIYNRLALPYMPNTVSVKSNDQNEIERIESISWQDLSTWAKTIESEIGTPKFGFPYSSVGAQLIYPITGMGLSMGMHTLPSFNNAGALKAWTYLSDLNQSNALAKGGNFAVLTQPTDLIASRDLWLSFGHMGPIGSAYKANPNQYVLGPIPKDQTTNLSGSTAGAWAYGVLSSSKRVKESKAWMKFITDPEINYLYCAGLGGVISPILEVTTHLGTSATDEIMRMGLSMLSQDVIIKIVDTSEYTDWNAVKVLYNALYERILNGESISENLLETYQTQLNALKKAS